MTAQPWPDPARPGVPRDADRDGTHLIRFHDPIDDGYQSAPIMAQWIADVQAWKIGSTFGSSEAIGRDAEYHGQIPQCILRDPAEVERMQAEADSNRHGPVAPPGVERDKQADEQQRQAYAQHLLDVQQRTLHQIALDLNCFPDTAAILAAIHDLQRRPSRHAGGSGMSETRRDPEYPKDGRLVPQFEAHCAGCQTPCMGLGETEYGAERQLRREGWQKHDVWWMCQSCSAAWNTRAKDQPHE